MPLIVSANFGLWEVSGTTCCLQTTERNEMTLHYNHQAHKLAIPLAVKVTSGNKALLLWAPSIVCSVSMVTYLITCDFSQQILPWGAH